MGKKIIFLDIDGVLNGKYFFKTRGDSMDQIDDEKVKILKYIIDSTGAKIVLSSAWRNFFDNDFDFPIHNRAKELVSALNKYGIYIYDKTDDNGKRGNEITDYIMNDNNIESFVILDDEIHDFYAFDFLFDHFVETNFDLNGLNWRHAEKAIEILETKINQYYRRS